MEDYISQNEIKDENIEKEEEYNLALDYYSKDNPFYNILIVTGIGIVSSYSTAVIAAGLSSAIIIGGHVFFTDTAFLVATGASALTGIGLIIAIPCLIGSISYKIYKYFKSKSLREYMEKLSDLKNDSMKEEREIYGKIFTEFKNYFQIKLGEKYNEIKNLVIDFSKKIISKINQIQKLFKEHEFKEDIILIKNKINNNMFNLNILIIGNTGVGKSTLINEFLQLKNNKAEESKGSKSMKIDNWPKKYPINEDDSPFDNIKLYDTEGIEKSNKEGNDIESHFKKIKKFIAKQEIFDNINAIWYCVSGNRLDGDEEYINKVINLYKNCHKIIPIIFIYTKAYSNKEEEIENIEEGLKDFEIFKKNQNEFHFIEIISKDYKNKKGEVKEKKKGLKQLFDLTINLSEKTFKFKIMQIISQHYNKKAEYIIKNLSTNLQEQYNNKIMKKEKFENIKYYINDIFNCSYGDYLKSNNEINNESSNIINKIETPLNSKNDNNNNEIDITYKTVDEIFKLIEKMKNEDLDKVIKSFDKKEDLYNKVKEYIEEKYKEKKCMQSFKDFNEDIEDYIITQFDSSKDIYALYFLYDMFRETILHEIIINLNEDFKKRKLETTTQLDILIKEKIEEFKLKFKQKNYSI